MRIGIDFGGTNIAVGIVDENYRILYKTSAPTRLGRPVDEMVLDMAKLCLECAAKVGVSLEEVASVGIASPGVINSETGEVEYYCNMDLYNYPLAERLRAALNGYDRIFAGNDANAAALGEAVAGAAKGASTAVMITLGTGVGGGVILDGKIYDGFNFSAAELGHVVIKAGGRPCPCGRKGCFEQYSSASALIRDTKEAMEAHPESALWKIAPTLECVNGKTAFDGMRMGDATATAVVDSYISDLALGLTNMVNIFQPEVLCIGGGICGEGETLRAPLEKLVMAEQYAKTTPKKTRLVIAALGNDAGIVGAAALGA